MKKKLVIQTATGLLLISTSLLPKIPDAEDINEIYNLLHLRTTPYVQSDGIPFEREKNRNKMRKISKEVTGSAIEEWMKYGPSSYVYGPPGIFDENEMIQLIDALLQMYINDESSQWTDK